MSWQPISTAPKDGTKFDGWCTNYASGGTRIPNVSWGHHEWFEGRPQTPMRFDYTSRVGRHYEDPVFTHWMPLPEPPKGASA